MASPYPSRAWWSSGGQPTPIDPEALLELLDEPNRLLAVGARDAVPNPYAPIGSAAAASGDAERLLDRIDQVPVDDERRALLRSFWTLNFNGCLDDAAATQATRWLALANGDWRLMFEACASFKIAGGTTALVQAMRADIKAEFRLRADVAAIDDDGDVVTVTLADGEQFRGGAALLTVPLHALPRISMTPALPSDASQAVEAGHLGLGTKVWFSVDGELPHFVAFGPSDAPFNFLQSEYHVEGRTIVIGFGPRARAVDVDDLSAVQAAVDQLVPDLRVVDASSHDWVADPYAGETWSMHRTGFLAEGLPALQRPHGRIQLAGSDIADGWGGFIDGAIESGLSAARRLLEPHDISTAAHPPKGTA